MDGLSVVYFAEAGVVLMLAPWTLYWERNYLLEALPLLQPLLLNPAVRGAISGVGVLSAVAACAELAALVLRLRRDRRARETYAPVTAGVTARSGRPW